MTTLLAMGLLMLLFGVAVVNERVGAAVAQPPPLLGLFLPIVILFSLKKLTPVERPGWVLAAIGFGVGVGAQWMGLLTLSAAGWLSTGAATVAYAVARRMQLSSVNRTTPRRNQVLGLTVIVIVIAAILLLPPSGP